MEKGSYLASMGLFLVHNVGKLPDKRELLSYIFNNIFYFKMLCFTRFSLEDFELTNGFWRCQYMNNAAWLPRAFISKS
jgi:hypothetical protein